MIAVILGAATLAIWTLYLKPAPVRRASLERMAFPLPDKPSIAVLPFVNMSKDPEQEFFSDGLTEEIITTLSKSPYLSVVARTSTFTCKGKSIPVDQVAQERTSISSATTSGSHLFPSSDDYDRPHPVARG